MASKVTIVNVGYRSTNYWVVSASAGRLLIDLGWPGMMGPMRANLARMDVPLKELRFGLATHYHIDHAGLAEELKSLGMTLLVLAPQVAAIPLMKAFTKPQDHYVDILPTGNRTISFAESRAVLAEVGIAGQIVPTPGHSDDSVSVVLDDGSVFTGDLTPLSFAEEKNIDALTASWRLLKEHGATTLYPGHGLARLFPASF